jgi:hypothetical protein
MRRPESVFAQIHASAPLVVIGFLTAALGAKSTSFWHHVAMEAGPNIVIAGAVAAVIERERIGRRQRFFLCALSLATLFLPMHVH